MIPMSISHLECQSKFILYVLAKNRLKRLEHIRFLSNEHHQSALDDHEFSEDLDQTSILIKELENYNILPSKKLQRKLDVLLNPYNSTIAVKKFY